MSQWTERSVPSRAPRLRSWRLVWSQKDRFCSRQERSPHHRLSRHGRRSAIYEYSQRRHDLEWNVGRNTTGQIVYDYSYTRGADITGDQTSEPPNDHRAKSESYSWPAVSHSWRRTVRSSKYIVLDKKSIPIVAYTLKRVGSLHTWYDESKVSYIKRVIIEVFPTPGSPRKTNLYLVAKRTNNVSYFSRGVIRGAPPSVVVESAAALIKFKNWKL